MALLGTAVVTGVDVTVSQAFSGDLLAVVGGFFAAAYMAVGAQARRSVSTTSYITICYATAAVALLAACLLTGELSGYAATDWLKLGVLTVSAQLLGHSVFNRVLRTTSATVVSLSIMFEPVGAALIAAAWLGQYPPAGVLPGLGLLLVGVALVITSRARPGSSPAPTAAPTAPVE